MHEAECAGGEEVRCGIEVASRFSAEGEGRRREAVSGDVMGCCGEDGAFEGREGTWGWWVGVGMVEGSHGALQAPQWSGDGCHEPVEGQFGEQDKMAQNFSRTDSGIE